MPSVLYFYFPTGLMWQEKAPAIIAIDVTEAKVERPKHNQKHFYSGKKKHHALKVQLVVDLTNFHIVYTAYGKGKQHDFSLFKASGVHFHQQTQGLADKGYLSRFTKVAF